MARRQNVEGGTFKAGRTILPHGQGHVRVELSPDHFDEISSSFSSGNRVGFRASSSKNCASCTNAGLAIRTGKFLRWLSPRIGKP